MPALLSVAYYPDLGDKCQIAQGAHVRAVGWLGQGHPYPTFDAAPPELLVKRLAAFREGWGASVSALAWPFAGGFHICEFCEKEADGSNFGILRGSTLYACPGMIGHYVAVHNYAPPAEFVNALQWCPLPGTADYQKAAVQFEPIVGSKSARIQAVFAELRISLGGCRLFPIPQQNTGTNTLLLGEAVKGAGEHRRVCFRASASSAEFEAVLGHGKFHDWQEFIEEERLSGLDLMALAALVDQHFRVD